MDIPDAPWIGHCKEEWDDMQLHFFDEDEDNFEIEQAERDLKEEDY